MSFVLFGQDLEGEEEEEEDDEEVVSRRNKISCQIRGQQVNWRNCIDLIFFSWALQKSPSPPQLLHLLLLILLLLLLHLLLIVILRYGCHYQLFSLSSTEWYQWMNYQLLAVLLESSSGVLILLLLLSTKSKGSLGAPRSVRRWCWLNYLWRPLIILIDAWVSVYIESFACCSSFHGCYHSRWLLRLLLLVLFLSWLQVVERLLVNKGATTTATEWGSINSRHTANQFAVAGEGVKGGVINGVINGYSFGGNYNGRSKVNRW